MIPKIIHYCWLSGDPYPESIQKCITSWKIFLPDYEFILWDAKKIDIESNLWLKQAFTSKKYAFAADYIRFYALFHYGGIYLDSDVEVMVSLDKFLHHQAFIGYEYTYELEPAVIGAVPKHPWIKFLLDYYLGRPFIKSNGNMDTTPLPVIISERTSSLYGIKYNEKKIENQVEDIDIYTYDYFSPKNFYTQKIYRTENTVAIHHFDGAWVNKKVGFWIKNIVHQSIIVIGGRIFHRRLINWLRDLNK